jgi:hypothetical protein
MAFCEIDGNIIALATLYILNGLVQLSVWTNSFIIFRDFFLNMKFSPGIANI